MKRIEDDTTGQFHIQATPWFDPDRILDCGQCFRWRRTDTAWEGIVGNRAVRLTRVGPSWRLEAPGTEWTFWETYFDLKTDYEALEARYLGLDPRLDQALALGRGIRLLRQPFWETVVSFVLSANNNIPRIQGMIARLCEAAGPSLGDGRHGFPEPEAVSTLTEHRLREMGFGYRAPFVVKLAQGFATGLWDSPGFREGTTEELRKRLMALPGVGPKVADCVLLFSLGHLDAFPVDTWIKKILAELDRERPESQHILTSLAGEAHAPAAGYIQQVLFYAARYQKWGV